MADFGVRITSGTTPGGGIRIASIAAAAGPQRFLALQASDINASISLGSLLTASVSDVRLEINTASPAPGTPVLDWNVAVDRTPGDGTFTPADVVVKDVKMTLATGALLVGGKLENIDLAGLVSGKATFEFRKETVDVDVDGGGFSPAPGGDLDNATLLLIGLTGLELSVGVGDFGLKITQGSVYVASLAPSAAGDSRRWMGVEATGLAATLNAGDLLSAGIANLELSINQASGGASALNWTTAVDSDGAAPFARSDVQVLDHVIGLTEDKLAVSGDLTGLTLAGFISGKATFALTRSTVSLEIPGQPSVAAATMMTFSLGGLELSIGDSGGVHVAINGGALALVMLRPNAPPPAAGYTDARSWMALRGTIGEATVAGLPPDLVLTARDLSIEINRASGSRVQGSTTTTAQPLDFTRAFDLNRDGTRGDLLRVGDSTFDFTGGKLRAAGLVELDLFGFVTGKVGFSFEQDVVDVDVNGNGTIAAAEQDADNAEPDHDRPADPPRRRGRVQRA